MEKYCKKLREWVMKIVNYEMRDMIPLKLKMSIIKIKKNATYVIKEFVMIKKVKII